MTRNARRQTGRGFGHTLAVWSVAVAWATLAGCRTDRPPQDRAADASGAPGGAADQSGNGMPAGHGPGDNDRSMSLNGIH
jgi:hypothetical protein